ncbi:TorD/DmsD family molecular chaperone [Raoultibacter massiliensis]|uniref:Molecular chaperone TorD family protein n=2 Tax=Raoultibacter massiliensis TaxID=1852371 RepID=A0ABV1J9Z8_9ACTN
MARTIGKADMCELLTHAFAYPDDKLAHALLDESFIGDCSSCFADIGCDGWGAEALPLPHGESGDGVLAFMRKEYTRIYLSPVRVLVYPYESAFLHVESGREGVPVLFRSAVTLDVEAQMREAGVMPKNARKEPCDSVFQEFEFMSFMYGSLAAAIQEGDEAACDLWQGRVERFLDEHALKWMPAFMERTIEHSGEGLYASFARIALVFLGMLSEEVVEREKELV